MRAKLRKCIFYVQFVGVFQLGKMMSHLLLFRTVEHVVKQLTLAQDLNPLLIFGLSHSKWWMKLDKDFIG
jgi:hypothetical protein